MGAIRRFDAIVIGVGGMGSAAAYHLARRGKRVLGLERYDIPNEMGSSHGSTRIIRLAYYEDPSYVPLLYRAYELWRELERIAREQLLFITGSIDAGPPGSTVFEGSRRSCEEHNLPYEALTGADVNRRFPGYRLPAEALAVFQPEGGFVLPERAIVAHVTAAQSLGAEIHGREQVLEWLPLVSGVRVRTDRGVYEADRLVVAAGAWASTLLDCLTDVAIPERQVLIWLQPKTVASFIPEHFPVFNLLVEEGRYYGLPVFGVPGFKVGRWHHRAESVMPDAMDRECHPYDEDLLRAFAERYFPDGAGPTMAMKACLFTNSPDEHFIIDLHPSYPQVSFLAGCSGHGYKFCTVIGEILADLAERGATRHAIDLFQLGRLRR